MPVAATAAACTMLLLGLAGCGSGSSDASSSGDLIAGADAICKKAQVKADALRPYPVNLEDAAETLAKSPAIFAPAVQELKALDPPDDLKAGYQAWLMTYDALIADTRQSVTAAKAGDQARFDQAAETYQQDADEANAAAAKLGMAECGRAGS